MNLLTAANDLKGLSDQQLQQQLLQPSGQMPSFLVLSELQRRGEVRQDYTARAQGGGPQPSMAEQYAQGIGGQANSPYANAVKQGEGAGMDTPPAQPPQGMSGPMDQPMPQGPQPGPAMGGQPQGFAAGGPVGMMFPEPEYDANGNPIQNDQKRDSYAMLGPVGLLGAQIANHDSFHDIARSLSPAYAVAKGLHVFADGGGVQEQGGLEDLGPLAGLFAGSRNYRVTNTGGQQGGGAAPMPGGMGMTSTAVTQPDPRDGMDPNKAAILRGLGLFADGGAVGDPNFLINRFNGHPYAPGTPYTAGMTTPGGGGTVTGLTGTMPPPQAPVAAPAAPALDPQAVAAVAQAAADPGLVRAAGGGDGGNDGGTGGGGSYRYGGGIRGYADGGPIPNETTARRYEDYMNALPYEPSVAYPVYRQTGQALLPNPNTGGYGYHYNDQAGYNYPTGLASTPPLVSYPYPSQKTLPGLQSQVRRIGPDGGPPPGVLEDSAPYMPNEAPPVSRGEFGQSAPAGLASVEPQSAGPAGNRGFDGPDPTPGGGPSDPSGGPAGGADPRALRAPPGAGAPPGGGGGGGGGGGAGGAGAGTLADYYRQMQDIKLPDRYGELAAENRKDKARLAGDREDAKGEALAAAGFAMAAGLSPNAITNIGQGGLAGLKSWNESTKELRQASRDVRNADQAIAIAQANRDEKGLENAMRLKQTAEDKALRLQEMHSRAGVASADRAQALELANKRLQSEDLDRTEKRFETQLQHHSLSAAGYEKQAQAAQLKLLALTADQTKQASPEDLASARRDVEYAHARSAAANEAHRLTENRYTAYSRKLPTPRTESEYAKLPSGTQYLHIDGEIKTKP